MEGTVADVRHRGGNGDGGETSAAVEGTVADGRHRGGDGDGDETGAATEDIVVYGLHSLLNCHDFDVAVVSHRATSVHYFHGCKGEIDVGQ